ncbi:FAD-binding oxidoreductase [Aliiroseovarius subalbicans]|uniref:NAD(P)/FAD-dependent oxidoreductase n=1 Tax=Aliiroseovarius subalbicans TaxID=2925840 RepID=UPI001F57DA60|nr:FAD-binding oxidoreductase [Aliiroseovarius subalbicans]MCI2399153.1 FAD-binding oxidoreductase [Aliiroseovarius subalbicans]
MDILTANDRVGIFPDSWYAASADHPGPYGPAEGEMSCDVCIIGAGFTGLSAALHMAEKGLNVVLLEAHRVGFGASGRNGGQVGTGQRVEQDELEEMVGKDRARALWDLSLESVQLVRDLVAAHAPEAEFVDGILHADHRARFVPESHDYARKLQDEYGYDLIRPVDRDEMHHLCGSPAYHGGTLDMGGGHVHPLRYAFGLARAADSAGARICETSRVTGVDQGDPATVRTDKAVIKAGHVLWACNGYLGHAEGHVATRVMPINNYILATEPLDESFARDLIRENHAVADSKFVINYFRLSEDNRMLFGGAESYGYRFPKDIRKLVSKPMLEIYPQLKGTRIDFAWGGTLGITMNRMPHFARLSGNILSASGYSGHGVAMATLGGKLAAEALVGQAGRFDLLADVPTPRFPGGAALRWPLLVAGMLWFSLRDRL